MWISNITNCNMDAEGLGKINHALDGRGIVVIDGVEMLSLDEGESHRFFSVEAYRGRLRQQLEDPSPLNERLDRQGLMLHEGYGVSSDAKGPLLKYLGSNANFHAYEDVAAK
jgi:hypothetical protein